MTLLVRQVVTGELESSLSTSLLNEGASPRIDRSRVLPFGWRTDIPHRNGQLTAGVMVPVPIWLIEGTEQRIIIDAGLGDAAEVEELMASYGVNFAAVQAPGQDAVSGLLAHGVRPEDVDLVVLTHLHFDHVGNTELFTRARFLVQRDELPYALCPPPFSMFYYPEYRRKIVDVLDRVDLVDGDVTIAPGVRLIKIGGHTPGCMAVLVDTPAGRVCLTSDVMYNYRNLELNWPTGSFWNLDELMRGYERIRAEADIIVPEHDWQFRELFPDGVIGL